MIVSPLGGSFTSAGLNSSYTLESLGQDAFAPRQSVSGLGHYDFTTVFPKWFPCTARVEKPAEYKTSA